MGQWSLNGASCCETEVQLFRLVFRAGLAWCTLTLAHQQENMTADGDLFYLFYFFFSGAVQGQDGQKVVWRRCQLDAQEFY